jgi:hypothetical protein
MMSTAELTSIYSRHHHGQARTDLDHNAAESLSPKNGKSSVPLKPGGLGGMIYEVRMRRHLATRFKALSGDSRACLVAFLLPGLLLSTHREQLGACKAWTLDSACVQVSVHNPKPYIHTYMGEGRHFTVIHLKLLIFAHCLREDLSIYLLSGA